MTSSVFQERLHRARARLDEALDGLTGDGDSQEAYTLALEEAVTAFADLEVASEEIDQQQAELAETRRLLEAERSKYEQHFHGAPEAYLVTRPDAVIREANRAAVDLLGVDRQYLIGKPLIVFIRRPHQTAHFAGIGEAHRTGSARWETVLSPRGRDSIPVEISVAAADPEAYRWIIRDLSTRVASEQRLREALVREQQAATELRQLDRLRGDFLLVVSHSLRTPIASILRTTELMERSERLDDASIRRALDIILDAAGHLDRLLVDLVDLERVATHAVELRPERTDLRALAADVVTAVTAGIRDVAVEGSTAPLAVDRAMVRRILANLLENALRHTPDEAAVGIELVAEDHGAEIVVWDTGPGVPDDDKEAIFELFRRGTSKADGSGIGLHLVSQFANLHGGSAWVEDRDGGGARFCVTLRDLG